jgi:hypothetical protein
MCMIMYIKKPIFNFMKRVLVCIMHFNVSLVAGKVLKFKILPLIHLCFFSSHYYFLFDSIFKDAFLLRKNETL